MIHIIIVHLFRKIVHLPTMPVILTRLPAKIYNNKKIIFFTNTENQCGAVFMHISNIKNISLKSRIFISFFSILLLMAVSCFFTISRFITRFTETQLNDDYDSILSETCDTMENLLWNITLTSGQILDNEEIQNTLMLYQDSLSPYERQRHYAALLDSVSMLTLANTDISLLQCIYG